MRRTHWFVAFVYLSCAFALAQTQYKVLWSFAGSPNDGSLPRGSLIFDESGDLYGTTYGGGNFGAGTVFKLSRNQDGTWNNTTIYSFCAERVNNRCQDGAFPQAGLARDPQGNLYGTTFNGGVPVCPQNSTGCGTIFRLSPEAGSWTETVLYDFCTNQEGGQCLDGSMPLGQLIIASGKLYGTTQQGGAGWGAAGTVFELVSDAGGWNVSVLYSFCSQGQGMGCPDGASPQAGVAIDKAGNLYGTTEYGGLLKNQGNGTIYKLSPSGNGWRETILHHFGTSGQGANPRGNISLDRSGNLYGTFANGGGPDRAGGGFRIRARDGKFESFSLSTAIGAQPAAGALIDSKHGTGYATTSVSGASDGGTVVKISTLGQISALYNFCSLANCMDGATPLAGLISDAAGNLYGTTEQGGAANNGVVFEIVQQTPKAPSLSASSRHASAKH